MALPASFTREGFLPPDQLRKRRRVMIGSEGPSDTGKTEFSISAPGPGIVICLDRNYEALFDNPRPPLSRRSDFGFKAVQVPLPTSVAQAEAVDYWKSFYGDLKRAIALPEVATVVIDGDSDSWELQRFAEFGRTSKVPGHLYDGVNAARRAMYARLHDSGKNIIATNKIKKHYVTKYKPDGTPELNNSGNEVRTWDGTWDRQGFGDQDYLWHIQIRHLFDEAKKTWGLRILKCKPDVELVGMELWGGDCNFAGLVQTVYPQVTLKEWGL